MDGRPGPPGSPSDSGAMPEQPPSHRRPGRTPDRLPLPNQPSPVRNVVASGWTPAAVRHARAAGDTDHLGWGVIAAPAEPPDGAVPRVRERLALLRRAQASQLRCERAVITHVAAGVAQGVPTYGPLGRPCLTVPSGTALRHLADAHLHRASLAPEELIRIDGHDFTGPARTVMDIARERGVDAGVVAADYVLHRKLADREELAAAVRACSTWPGRRSARIALALADGDAESPLESISRLRIAAAGLPAPLLQVEFCDMDGVYITRSDFYWPEFGVVGEADGLEKYDAEGRVAARQEETHTALVRCGLEVVRWGWEGVFPFDPTAREIELAFRRGARPGSPRRRWGIVLRSH